MVAPVPPHVTSPRLPSGDPGFRSGGLPGAWLRRWWLLPGLCLALTAVAWFLVRHEASLAHGHALAAAAESVRSRAVHALGHYDHVLRGVRAMVESGPLPEPARWDALIESLQAEQRLPGLRVVGLMESVPAAALARHEAVVRARSGRAYQVRPVRDAGHHYPVVLLAPENALTRQVLGFDPSSEPVRAEALERARGTGRLAATRLVTLQPDDAPGFLLFLATESAPARRSDGRAPAFVYAAVEGRALARDSLGEAGDRVRMRWLREGGEVLFDSAAGLPEEAPTGVAPVRLPLSVAGQSLVAEFQPREALLATVPSIAPRSLLLAGALATLLALLVVRILRAGVLEAESAHAAARAAQERQHQFRQALLDAIPNPICVTDRSHRVVLVNDAWCAAQGLTREGATGQLVDALPSAPTTGDQGVDGDALFASGGSERREEAGPDGRWSLLSRHVVALTDGSRYLIATRVDIHDRKMAEDSLALQRDTLELAVQVRTAELVAARDEAQVANRAKSEFLANISHELRTPMHAILSFARLGAARLGDAEPDTARVQHYLQRIGQSGDRLMTLLNDLLDLAKLEAGRMVYDEADHDLGRLAEAVAAEFEAAARDRNVGVAVTAPEPALVRVDSHRMAQVVRNLLSNALRFSPAGGTVRVAVEPCGSSAVCLSVADQGPGIPEHELEAVFDKFVQSSTTRSGAGGTGLGLAITREIVQHHGGRVWAARGPEGGALFTVQLPRVAGQAMDGAPSTRGTVDPTG